MALADFESLLKAVDGAGRRLDRLVGHRARGAGAACRPASSTTPDAYWELVRASATELQALIEAVVVPETWFFRDREAFAALARMAREEWLPRASGRRAAPAEPAVLDRRRAVFDGDGAARRRCAGRPLSRSTPSTSARARWRSARRGVYGKNSFRGSDLAFRDRHFDATPRRAIA